jgi:hypothetical protein
VVHAVCSRRNARLVESLGAERVFDYTVEDFTTSNVVMGPPCRSPGTAARRHGVARRLVDHALHVGRGGSDSMEECTRTTAPPVGSLLQAERHVGFGEVEETVRVGPVLNHHNPARGRVPEPAGDARRGSRKLHVVPSAVRTRTVDHQPVGIPVGGDRSLRAGTELIHVRQIPVDGSIRSEAI